MKTTCGVYCITCVPTGKVYIGSSTNIQRRWKAHRWNLNQGQHGNPYLQAAWNKYGADAFHFEVVERTSDDQRIACETIWIEQMRAADRAYGYNITPYPIDSGVVADETRERQRLAWTPERRASLGNANRSRELSPEIRASMSRSFLSEVREKIASTLRGRKLNEEHRTSISNGLRGHDVSDETRARIGNVNARKHFIVTDPSGLEYYVTNLSQFCREQQLDAPNMSNVAQGKRPHHRGWKCRYA